MFVFVCPIYISCVHRSKVYQYKLCIIVQYICTWIYIYKPIYPKVCPVYMSFPFLIHRCGVRGRTWAFLLSGKEIWNFLCTGGTSTGAIVCVCFRNFGNRFGDYLIINTPVLSLTCCIITLLTSHSLISNIPFFCHPPSENSRAPLHLPFLSTPYSVFHLEDIQISPCFQFEWLP
jgi:hypothetical protein